MRCEDLCMWGADYCDLWDWAIWSDLKSFQTHEANVDLFYFLIKGDDFGEKKIFSEPANPRLFPHLKWKKRKTQHMLNLNAKFWILPIEGSTNYNVKLRDTLQRAHFGVKTGILCDCMGSEANRYAMWRFAYSGKLLIAICGIGLFEVIWKASGPTKQTWVYFAFWSRMIALVVVGGGFQNLQIQEFLAIFADTNSLS